MATIAGSVPIVIPTLASADRLRSVTKTILTKTTYGTSGETDKIVGCSQFKSFLFTVKIANQAGTSPTLNVYLQNLMPDGSTWGDFASLTQITTNGTYQQPYVVGATAPASFTLTDGTLTAGTVKVMPICDILRVKLTYGGTNPRHDVTLGIEFFF